MVKNGGTVNFPLNKGGQGGRRTLSGFSFLELLVVVFLMAMMSALVLSRVISMVERKENFEERLTRFFVSARIRNVARQETLLMVIDPSQRALVLFGAEDFSRGEPLIKLRVPEEVEVKEAGTLELGEGLVGILLFAEGYSSGGELEFVNRETGKTRVFFFPKAQMIPFIN